MIILPADSMNAMTGEPVAEGAGGRGGRGGGRGGGGEAQAAAAGGRAAARRRSIAAGSAPTASRCCRHSPQQRLGGPPSSCSVLGQGSCPAPQVEDRALPLPLPVPWKVLAGRPSTQLRIRRARRCRCALLRLSIPFGMPREGYALFLDGSQVYEVTTSSPNVEIFTRHAPSGRFSRRADGCSVKA